MTYLLDVSALIAGLWKNHPANARLDTWFKGKELATCPLSELGFLRISSDPKGPVRAQLRDCQQLLRAFLQTQKCRFLSDDLSALLAPATDSKGLTDSYLGELAARHGMKLATLDTRITHGAVELIA